MTRDEIVTALEAELDKRNEWYGLDNWEIDEVVNFILDRATDESPQVQGTVR